jgi:hypothetical protein
MMDVDVEIVGTFEGSSFLDRFIDNLKFSQQF